MSEPRGEVVECQVCHDEVGRGPNGLGLISHSSRHRREFRERFGRRPEGYEEVREKLGGKQTDQLSLWESATDEEQALLSEVER